MGKRIFLIVLFLWMFFPITTYGLTKESSIISINESLNIEVDNIEFKNINYKSYTNNLNFGLVGTVKNKKNNSVKYDVIGYYYNSKKELLIEINLEKSVDKEKEDEFNFLNDLSIFDGITLDDIAYYKLVIVTYDSDDNIIRLSSTSEYSSYTYIIDKYDISVVINDDNSYDITETYDFHFNKPIHGFVRRFGNGDDNNDNVKIKNISADSDYQVFDDNENYTLDIKENHYIYGNKKYVIKYTVDFSSSTFKELDNIYYYFLYNDTQTYFGNVTFSMSLPKDFDESTIEFYDGEFGETKSKNVNYKVKNNVIYGNYDGVLKSNEALLIKCDLPNGYFINYNDEFSIARLILLFIPILLAMEALLFYKYYKNSIIYAKIFLIISIIVSYCIVFLSSLNLLDRVIDNYFLILLFIFAIFVLMLYSLFSNRFSQKVKLIIIFTGIIICLILWIIIVLPAILNKIFYLIESIIAFLLIIILWICLGYMFKK